MSFVHTRGPLPPTKTDANVPSGAAANRVEALDLNRLRQAALDLAAYAEAHIGLSVTEFGADSTGASDSSAAFTSALAAGKYVVVPSGTYLISSTVNIPNYTILKLMPGAFLNLSATLTINGDGAGLIGADAFGWQELNLTPLVPMIKWIGAINSTMIQVGTNRSPLGPGIIGVTLSGGGIAGITGILCGSVGFGPADALFEKIAIYETFVAFEVLTNSQQNYVRKLTANNNSAGINNGTANSIGVAVGVRTTSGGITSWKFESLIIQGFETGIQCGNGTTAGTGCGALCIFEGKNVLEGFPTQGVGVRCLSGGPYVFKGIHYEKSAAVGNYAGRAFIIGSVTQVPNGITITECDLNASVSGTVYPANPIFELFAFDGLAIYGNRLDYSNSFNACVLNTGGGPRQIKGSWFGNYTFPNVSTTLSYAEFVNDNTTGFAFVQKLNMYADQSTGLPFPVTKNGSFSIGLATNAVAKLCTDEVRGECKVFNANNNWALFIFRGTGHFADGPFNSTGGAGIWSNVQGNAGTVNLYWSAANSRYEIENKTAGSVTISVQLQSQI